MSNVLVAGGEFLLSNGRKTGSHYGLARMIAQSGEGLNVHVLDLCSKQNAHNVLRALGVDCLVVDNAANDISDGEDRPFAVGVRGALLLQAAHSLEVPTLALSEQFPAWPDGMSDKFQSWGVVALRGDLPTLDMIEASRSTT